MEVVGEAQTVAVRVQVIDVRSFTLDLVLPMYLPARDLTQRVARDAGLNAFWPDGRRRLYWLRARGRLMGEEERLMDLGVVPQELIHLLPEPPPGSGVVEQVPDYPENRGYAGKGVWALLGSLAVVMLYAVGWGLALSIDRGYPVVILPGLALGMLTCSVGRHMFGGQGTQVRIAAVGLVMALILVALAFAPGLYLGEDPAALVREAVPGLVAAMAGVLLAWLAWWGAVEPLPPKPVQVVEQVAEVQLLPCGICGLGVSPDMRVDCGFGCGKAFHKGCQQARLAVAKKDPTRCGVCGVQVSR